MTTGFFPEHGHKEGWEETRRSGLGGEFKTNFACSTVHLMERKRGEKEEARCEATHTGAESSRGNYTCMKRPHRNASPTRVD